MAKKNSYRTQAGKKSELKQLEKVKLLRDKLRRVRKNYRLHLSRGLKKALIIIPLVTILGFGGYYAVQSIREHAATLNISNIHVESEGYMSKQEILDMLDLQDGAHFISIDTKELTKKLEASPLIHHANVTANFPDTLNIQVQERFPLALIEMEDGILTGQRERFFICKEGHILPIIEGSFHQQFLHSPIWYVRPTDYDQYSTEGRIKEQSLESIVELIEAINQHQLDALPAVTEIHRPKEWKIILSLETGTEVVMRTSDIKGQMERLITILQHARDNQRLVRSVNVIPEINPAVVYAD